MTVRFPSEKIKLIPDYLKKTYYWAYLNPRNVKQLDRNIVVKILLFFNDQRLMRAYLSKIRPGDRVWQVAHVYGDLVKRASYKTGSNGHFLLTDVAPIQIQQAQKKLKEHPNAHIEVANAAYYQTPKPCNLICSFFLLHEVPDEEKYRIVNNMLQQLPEGAKVLFVDYHRPKFWQPIGWLLKYVNRWLEPFAESLWHNDIQAFAKDAHLFHWKKETFFGGIYQAVTVQRR